MTNKQILKKAIEKAIKNGWDSKDPYNYLDMDISGVIVGMWHIPNIIFSHSFAKTFWGEGSQSCNYLCRRFMYARHEEFCKKGCLNNMQPAWQYHLQQMVLKKEPLLYLERFLNE